MSGDIVRSEYHFQTDSDLKFINGRANLYEETEGPLVLMGNKGGNSFLTFDGMQPSPAKPVAISKRAGSAPAIPAGAVLVASGDIYVEGNLVTCDAIRGP